MAAMLTTEERKARNKKRRRISMQIMNLEENHECAQNANPNKQCKTCQELQQLGNQLLELSVEKKEKRPIDFIDMEKVDEELKNGTSLYTIAELLRLPIHPKSIHSYHQKYLKTSKDKKEEKDSTKTKLAQKERDEKFKLKLETHKEKARSLIKENTKLKRELEEKKKLQKQVSELSNRLQKAESLLLEYLPNKELQNK